MKGQGSMSHILRRYLNVVSLVELVQFELVHRLGLPQTQVANSVGAIPWDWVVICSCNDLQIRVKR